MYNYLERIEEFIQDNFEASTPDEANMKFTTREFLNFLFQTFPNDCISDYDLNEILHQLGYKRQLYNIEHVLESFSKKEIKYELVSGWCLYSKELKPNEIITLQNQSE